MLSHQNFAVQIIVIPLFVLVNIVIMDGFNLHPGLVGANATLLIIALTIPENAYVSYAISRVFDTFFGVVVATLVNSAFIHDAPKVTIKKISRDKVKKNKQVDSKAKTATVKKENTK
ncbi:Predicted membrane protein [Lactococcus raffinolactis 4877]|nr:Predicted membrane protein [Lactococcus raffinolactis 4877]